MGRDADTHHEAAIAHHEAAHFVACRTVGCGRVLRLRQLGLTRRGRFLGRVIGYQKADPSPAELEDLVTILYAGQAASQRLYGAASSPRELQQTRDGKRAEKLLAQLGDPRAERRLRRRAQRLVSRHWSDIELVARALLAKRTLEIDEAHALLDDRDPTIRTARETQARGR